MRVVFAFVHLLMMRCLLYLSFLVENSSHRSSWADCIQRCRINIDTKFSRNGNDFLAICVDHEPAACCTILGTSRIPTVIFKDWWPKLQFEWSHFFLHINADILAVCYTTRWTNGLLVSFLLMKYNRRRDLKLLSNQIFNRSLGALCSKL